MSILKAATWKSSGSGECRKVTWGTTSEKVEMESVNFTGKFILLTNVPMKGVEAKAFLSRSLHISIDFSVNESINLLKSAATTAGEFPNPGMGMKVAEFLSEKLLLGIPNISLRTLKLGYELAESQPENWQRLIEILLDKPTCAVNKENLITFDSNAKVEEQFKRFKD
jgi:hypothetical protein